jgi:hypothetical protein
MIVYFISSSAIEKDGVLEYGSNGALELWSDETNLI